MPDPLIATHQEWSQRFLSADADTVVADLFVLPRRTELPRPGVASAWSADDWTSWGRQYGIVFDGQTTHSFCITHPVFTAFSIYPATSSGDFRSTMNLASDVRARFSFALQAMTNVIQRIIMDASWSERVRSSPGASIEQQMVACVTTHWGEPELSELLVENYDREPSETHIARWKRAKRLMHETAKAMKVSPRAVVRMAMRETVCLLHDIDDREAFGEAMSSRASTSASARATIIAESLMSEAYHASDAGAQDGMITTGDNSSTDEGDDSFYKDNAIDSGASAERLYLALNGDTLDAPMPSSFLNAIELVAERHANAQEEARQERARKRSSTSGDRASSDTAAPVTAPVAEVPDQERRAIAFADAMKQIRTQMRERSDAAQQAMDEAMAQVSALVTTATTFLSPPSPSDDTPLVQQLRRELADCRLSGEADRMAVDELRQECRALRAECATLRNHTAAHHDVWRDLYRQLVRELSSDLAPTDFFEMAEGMRIAKKRLVDAAAIDDREPVAQMAHAG